MKAVGATYHIFDFFLPEWRVQAKTVEYQKNGMKLKQRLSLLVAWFRNTRGQDYAADIHMHPFYIIYSHEDFVERFMKRLDDNEEGEMGKDPDSVYEFKRTRSWWKLKDENEADGEIIGFLPEIRMPALLIPSAKSLFASKMEPRSALLESSIATSMRSGITRTSTWAVL